MPPLRLAHTHWELRSEQRGFQNAYRRIQCLPHLQELRLLITSECIAPNDNDKFTSSMYMLSRISAGPQSSVLHQNQQSPPSEFLRVSFKL